MTQKYLIKINKGAYKGKFWMSPIGNTSNPKKAHQYTPDEIKTALGAPCLLLKHDLVLLPVYPYEAPVNLEVPYEPIGD